MRNFTFGHSKISETGPAYFIAEIGHNHQGDLQTALKMIKVAKDCGVDCVKFQKRDNKNLFTRAYYDRPYDNENSYGETYGKHREFLEFGEKEYTILMRSCEELQIEFMSTAFDAPSADFLERLGVSSYKIASADVTNTPLLDYIAKFKKPMFISTGAASIEEIGIAYETVRKHNDRIVLLHCTAGYPTDYPDLNLRAIETLRRTFPEAAIGYSGHDNGVLACSIAYMLGASVLEKHFTLNHSWKGTDHKFSLEPDGLRKQVRDLRRIDLALGDGRKTVKEFERDARAKMGKSIYAAHSLKAGQILTANDLVVKSPGGGLMPYELSKVLSRKLKVNLAEEARLTWDALE